MVAVDLHDHHAVDRAELAKRLLVNPHLGGEALEPLHRRKHREFAHRFTPAISRGLASSPLSLRRHAASPTAGSSTGIFMCGSRSSPATFKRCRYSLICLL